MHTSLRSIFNNIYLFIFKLASKITCNTMQMEALYSLNILSFITLRAMCVDNVRNPQSKFVIDSNQHKILTQATQIKPQLKLSPTNYPSQLKSPKLPTFPWTTTREYLRLTPMTQLPVT